MLYLLYSMYVYVRKIVLCIVVVYNFNDFTQIQCNIKQPLNIIARIYLH